MNTCCEHGCTGCRKPCTNVDPDLQVPGIPISMSGVGETGTVVRILGRENVKRFLHDLGFTPGTRVSTVSTNGGNVILDLMGSRIAIDRTMASRIMFSPER